MQSDLTAHGRLEARLAELRRLSGAPAAAPLRLLFLHEHVPDPDSSGADLRLLAVLRALRNLGHEIALLTRYPDRDSRVARWLSPLGVECVAGDPYALAFFWDSGLPPVDHVKLFARGRFDAVVMCTWFWCGESMAERYLHVVRERAPGTRVVILTDDVHWLREKRRAKKQGARWILERALAIRAREADVYPRADLIWAITEEDQERLRPLAGNVPLVHVRHTSGPLPERVPGGAGRTGLLYVGSGENEANVRALEWFTRDAWPALRRATPELELTVVGAPPRRGWPASLSQAGIRLVGQQKDLRPWFDRSRVFVSPITYGTGIKTKNILAMAHGVPLVTTSVGAEGMRLAAGGPVRVCDDALELAAAVRELLRDDEAWTRASREGRRHLEERFSPELLEQDLRDALALLRTLPAGTDASRVQSLQVESHRPDVLTDPGTRLVARGNARIRLATEHLQGGRLDDAVRELRTVMLELPTADPAGFHPVLSMLAQIYAARSQWEDALQCAEEIARMHPGPGEARALLRSIQRQRPAPALEQATT